MGYGKGRKKSKQAIANQYAELRAERNRYIAEFIVGLVLAVVAMSLQVVVNFTEWVSQDVVTGLGIAGFVLLFVGAILAAFGLIKYGQVNGEFKRVAQQYYK